MIKKNISLYLFSTLFIFSFSSYSKEDHSHDEHEKTEAHDGHADHGEEDFQISTQAEKNFEIKRQSVGSNPLQEVPKSALVTTGTEVNLYRYRNNHYKRIDFEIVRKTEKILLIKSKDLKAGDEIVIHGTGLLRIAEIAAFGGAPEGHSH